MPTSTSAGPTALRPEVEIGGTMTRLLVEQIRSTDVDYSHGEPVHHLDRDEIAEVEHAVVREGL
ncbi:hypothetical protein [Cryptosporangium sp. NPDC048952]|uniref:hypothetical protein n=1 Tax=Cryptosporangium sp. NPDC048952 TaxID=3363961 RepID=UPI00371FE522